ncbi:unnamed protein product [Oikopleura dioica]|uniref:Uncharacterized protein n=1 Tax=Oikopleura dioica TaxID=34765 RepID=E4XQC0_OIKDI|nr:unnamed protein product [Oikopleura dioica]
MSRENSKERDMNEDPLRSLDDQFDIGNIAEDVDWSLDQAELPNGDVAGTRVETSEPQTAEEKRRSEEPEPPAEEERERPETPPIPETPEGTLVIDENPATAQAPESAATSPEPAEPDEARSTPRVRSTVVVVNKATPGETRDIRTEENWTMADYGLKGARASPQRQLQNWDNNRGGNDRYYVDPPAGSTFAPTLEQWLAATETRRMLNSVDTITTLWEQRRYRKAYAVIEAFSEENRRYRIERENAVRKDAEPPTEALRAQTGSGRVYHSTSSEDDRDTRKRKEREVDYHRLSKNYHRFRTIMPKKALRSGVSGLAPVEATAVKEDERANAKEVKYDTDKEPADVDCVAKAESEPVNGAETASITKPAIHNVCDKLRGKKKGKWSEIIGKLYDEGCTPEDMLREHKLDSSESDSDDEQETTSPTKGTERGCESASETPPRKMGKMDTASAVKSLMRESGQLEIQELLTHAKVEELKLRLSDALQKKAGSATKELFR